MPLDDLPDWLPAWCVDQLGDEPVSVLFELRQISAVFGLRLAGGRDVVVKAREDDGRAWKCTLCYDRLGTGLEPACAKACPTESIQFGPLDELRDRAEGRLAQLHAVGVADARLYGEDPGDGVGGDGAFFRLLDEPEVYGLPPDPVVTTRDLPVMWRRVCAAAATLAAGTAAAFAVAALGGRK